jgi:hypothetical protein
MWEPRRLTNLWAFMACCRDSFTFLKDRCVEEGHRRLQLEVVQRYLTLWRVDFIWIIFQNLALTSQKALRLQYLLVTLFREMIAIYCENRTKHKNTLCGKGEVSVVNRGVKYSNHCALLGTGCVIPIFNRAACSFEVQTSRILRLHFGELSEVRKSYKFVFCLFSRLKSD